jgi:hypothetical protein
VGAHDLMADSYQASIRILLGSSLEES